MPTTLTPTLFHQLLRSGSRVYAPGCAGHSLLFQAWLQAHPAQAAGVTFSGVWIPGVNTFDFAGLGDACRAEGFFMSPQLRASYEAGRFDYLPMHYNALPAYLGQTGHFDLALVQVAPPDSDGNCSLGIAADFTPAALASGARIVAHINPRMPRTRGPHIAWRDIAYAVEADHPLLTLEDEAPDPVLQALASQVVARIGDGSTLQFGLGKLQAAVLEMLGGHRGLRIHSGMVSTALCGLADSGALAAPGPQGPPVTAGVALGSEALYRRVADPQLVRFAPVSHTHAAATLAGIERFISINSALNVDLLGQVNGETLNGRQVSGVGGMLDFVRGARESHQGLSILALPATARNGTLSRIVPILHGLVSVPRTDVDCIVTEYGCADLRHLGVAGRARALIDIAAPAFREQLAAAWRNQCGQL
ncbi:acetyl-CoA hydrolase/transferase family protein [Janthinobacterium sp. NFX145]|uniref:acetyl-CoA hydrolase/transferase family protein n=1 Tax=Janthinobacterium sp. NFX145 TaxID=3415602 RepID=UPI003CC56CE4